MRNFILTILLCTGFNCLGQVSVKSPLYWWVSKFQFKYFQELPVGTKILFVQNCTTSLPAEVPTGILFFENVCHLKEQFSVSVEFKDTVVVAMTYYLRAKQIDFLKELGFPKIEAHGSAIKGQWTYTLQEEKRRTTIVGDKKRIVVVQTI